MRLFIIFFIFSTACFSKGPFKHVLREMKEKNYAYALVKLKNINGSVNLMEKRSFLEAICLTNLGEPNKAINRLKGIKNHFNGIDFELGRAFYFTENFKKAKLYFKKSIKQGYKKSQGYHYLGSLYLKLKDFKTAKKYFQMILSSTTPAKWILQDTYYQIGNIHLEIAKRKLRPEDMGQLLKDHVLSYFKKSLQISPESKVAKKVRKNIYLVKAKYQID